MKRVPQQLQRFGDNLKTWQPQARVYFLLRDGEVVYIGQTMALDRRLYSHSGKQYDSVMYLEVDAEDLKFVESEMITLLRPSLNKIGANFPLLAHVGMRHYYYCPLKPPPTFEFDPKQWRSEAIACAENRQNKNGLEVSRP